MLGPGRRSLDSDRALSPKGWAIFMITDTSCEVMNDPVSDDPRNP
jgi:hypothetical protein